MDLSLGGSKTNWATMFSSDMRMIQTLFSLAVFMSDVHPPSTTLILVSVVKAPFESFLGLTPGLAKIALIDQITLCARYILNYLAWISQC